MKKRKPQITQIFFYFFIIRINLCDLWTLFRALDCRLYVIVHRLIDFGHKTVKKSSRHLVFVYCAHEHLYQLVRVPGEK